MEKKSERWNIAIGIACSSFFEMPKAFVGSFPCTWSYSSDGRMRYQLPNNYQSTPVKLDQPFPEYGTGDIIGLFVDMHAHAVTFFKNGHAVHSLTNVKPNTESMYATVTVHATGDMVALKTTKMSLSPFKMLEMMYRAESSYQQVLIQQHLKQRLHRLKELQESFKKV